MSRYVARNEFFGCLIFDRENNNYIPFDSEATRFFRSGALREPTEEKEKRNFTDFVNSCKALGILDEREKFPHPWLDNRTNDDFLSAPLKISLNITSDCNLRCRHCYALAGGTDEKGMAFERLKHLVDEMARNGVFLLSIKGGEPFSHPAL
ncbi:MAG: 4Fe-4S cluster-binding domain-containing protein, partial [Armatimonadetes bacterium]|nr:4Fe-4S cluster-binding domain-containing protein [Armatimonadota bacterium]